MYKIVFAKCRGSFTRIGLGHDLMIHHFKPHFISERSRKRARKICFLTKHVLQNCKQHLTKLFNHVKNAKRKFHQNIFAQA